MGLECAVCNKELNWEDNTEINISLHSQCLKKLLIRCPICKSGYLKKFGTGTGIKYIRFQCRDCFYKFPLDRKYLKKPGAIMKIGNSDCLRVWEETQVVEYIMIDGRIIPIKIGNETTDDMELMRERWNRKKAWREILKFNFPSTVKITGPQLQKLPINLVEYVRPNIKTWEGVTKEIESIARQRYEEAHRSSAQKPRVDKTSAGLEIPSKSAPSASEIRTVKTDAQRAKEWVESQGFKEFIIDDAIEILHEAAGSRFLKCTTEHERALRSRWGDGYLTLPRYEAFRLVQQILSEMEQEKEDKCRQARDRLSVSDVSIE